jgi:hypothetical protein
MCSVVPAPILGQPRERAGGTAADVYAGTPEQSGPTARQCWNGSFAAGTGKPQKRTFTSE